MLNEYGVMIFPIVEKHMDMLVFLLNLELLYQGLKLGVHLELLSS